MKRGSHIAETKNSLNNLERKLLTYLLEPLDQETSFAATSLEIDEMLKNTELVKGKRWTHHSTTELLSNLVGMDLVEELTGFMEDDKQNNITPVYVIEYTSTIHSRAVYARDRDNSKGISLFHIIRGDEEYGENLWPNRPVDRVKLEGKVVLHEGKPQLILPYNPWALKDMVGMVNIVITQ